VLKKQSQNESYALSIEKIQELLKIDNTRVIKEIYKIVFDMLYEENERSKQIDSKGSSFIGLIGLSTSLVFSLGGLLIEKITNVHLPVIGCPMPLLVTFYFTTSITLLLSIFYSYYAIKIRSNWRWLNDVDIFQEAVLKEESANYYRRYMITHAWTVFRTNFKVNETKGKFLKYSQALFVCALIQLAPIIMILGFYALKKGGYFQ
jgi:hypothetical protein